MTLPMYSPFPTDYLARLRAQRDVEQDPVSRGLLDLAIDLEEANERNLDQPIPQPRRPYPPTTIDLNTP